MSAVQNQQSQVQARLRQILVQKAIQSGGMAIGGLQIGGAEGDVHNLGHLIDPLGTQIAPAVTLTKPFVPSLPGTNPGVIQTGEDKPKRTRAKRTAGTPKVVKVKKVKKVKKAPSLWLQIVGRRWESAKANAVKDGKENEYCYSDILKDKTTHDEYVIMRTFYKDNGLPLDTDLDDALTLKAQIDNTKS